MIDTKVLKKLALKAAQIEDDFKAQQETCCSIKILVTVEGIEMQIKSGTIHCTHFTPFGVIDDMPGRVLEIDLDEAMYRFMELWVYRPIMVLNRNTLEQIA